jgi:hypothetical protein
VPKCLSLLPCLKVACSLELDLAGVGAAGIACAEPPNLLPGVHTSKGALFSSIFFWVFFSIMMAGVPEWVSGLRLFSRTAEWAEDFFWPSKSNTYAMQLKR